MTRANLIENLNVLCRYLRSIDLDIAANVCERAAEQITTDGTELERLQGRLPVTADGVRISLGDIVWMVTSKKVVSERRVYMLGSDVCWVMVGYVSATSAQKRCDEIYSTREAAEKARQA